MGVKETRWNRVPIMAYVLPIWSNWCTHTHPKAWWPVDYGQKINGCIFSRLSERTMITCRDRLQERLRPTFRRPSFLPSKAPIGACRVGALRLAKPWRVMTDHPHRFKGFSHAFSFAVQGPAEQILPYLNDPKRNRPTTDAGIVCRGDDGNWVHNAPEPWNERFLTRVDWTNIHRLKNEALVPFTVSSAQVLQQIGCPHAAKSRWLEVDYPAFIDPDGKRTVRLKVEGCSFCDVAMDKGFFGSLGTTPVLDRLRAPIRLLPAFQV